ncbi:hypothetical protein PDJAM_G00224980 [Pangasius djambal]|uniref:Uncharacterized protein n=1 Tax=Pangasius djambal TaxID=1691987 RepID=A0ACC5YD69_9TELE|nr:hypothetical protein [Pangasius djambal]
MMERRKVDILCVQETRWKGSKARSIGAGFKLFCYGVDSKRNGVGVVLKEEFGRNVLEVKRVSDRVMSLKLEIEGLMLNVVSGYAPQVGCELEEKERFWSELDEVIKNIPTGERVVIGADFNGHVGEGNTGDEEVMGKFGVKERNLEGQMVVDFAKRVDMAVVNTYFQKREEHRVTYKSGEVKDRDREENQVVEAEKGGMYERSRTVVRCAVGQTEEFKVEVGLHQGSALSPFLFAMVMDQLSEFKYLASTVQSNGECGKEVKKRVQAGLETVSLRKRQELEVAELKRMMFALGVTRLDRIRNEYIRGTAHAGRLGDKVREARLRWFGHVQRRESEYIGRRMLDMELPGRRQRGRPKRRYMDIINEDMKLVGASVEDAEDRDRWRVMIRCGDP